MPGDRPALPRTRGLPPRCTSGMTHSSHGPPTDDQTAKCLDVSRACWCRWQDEVVPHAHHRPILRGETNQTKPSLIMPPALGIPETGEHSQELRLRGFPSVRLLGLCALHSLALPKVRSLGPKGPKPGLLFHSRRWQLSQGWGRLAKALPSPRAPAPVTLSGPKNRTYIVSFILFHNNLSFLPSWEGCLVMNVDGEDNKELSR